MRPSISAGWPLGRGAHSFWFAPGQIVRQTRSRFLVEPPAIHGVVVRPNSPSVATLGQSDSISQFPLVRDAVVAYDQFYAVTRVRGRVDSVEDINRSDAFIIKPIEQIIFGTENSRTLLYMFSSTEI